MNDTPKKRIEDKWRREMNTSQDLTPSMMEMETAIVIDDRLMNIIPNDCFESFVVDFIHFVFCIPSGSVDFKFLTHFMIGTE